MASNIDATSARITGDDRSPAQRTAIAKVLERRGKGVCVACGVPVASKAEYPRCRECHRIADGKKRESGLRATLGKRLRERRDASGLCQKCGKREPIAGVKYCEVCRQKALDLARSRSAARSNSGLCTGCGKRSPESGSRACEACRNKRRRWHTDRVERENRDRDGRPHDIVLLAEFVESLDEVPDRLRDIARRYVRRAQSATADDPPIPRPDR